MKQKPKLALKKIIVSNLADDVAKRVYGGDEPTYGDYCTDSCQNRCTESNDGAPGCNSIGCPSDIYTNCNSEPTCDSNVSCGNWCWSERQCTYGECTDQNATCVATHNDPGCVTGTCVASACPC